MPKTPDMDVAHPQLQFKKNKKSGTKVMSHQAQDMSLTAFKRRTVGRGFKA